MAWLNTPPDPPKDSKAKPASRLARFKSEGLAIDLPDNPAPYVTTWLMEIGPVVSNGMGSAVIGWGDLTSWQDLTGNELTPWEARTLRSLSRDFLDQTSKARAQNCPPPFIANPRSNDDAVAAQFKQMFDAMKRNQAGGKR